MIQEINIRVQPGVHQDPIQLKQIIASELNIPTKDITEFKILKRSIDARARNIVYQLKIQVAIQEKIPVTSTTFCEQKNVASRESVIVIGAGPAGLFAAVELIQLGLKPIVLERGKSVRERRRDLKAINQDQIVNPDSNYCFGEGGAGTYSDGKLYTRSIKRGDVQKVLNILIEHGAHPDIAVDAHPHIGTNKLPEIITSIREYIISCGGEIYFEHRVTDFIIQNNQVKGVIASDQEFIADNIILATGHSARDIFVLLNRKKIIIEAKPFALGVRVEHQQQLIDQIQYKCADRGEHLPPSSYNLVTQTKFKPVYNFCMCPGGIIAPCATSPGEVVTNGWSPSKRNNPYSNSGIVVAVDEKDFIPFQKHGALAGMYFQSSIEQKAWELGGKSQVVPAQRLIDFTKGKTSSNLPKTSYQPGVNSVDLKEVFPSQIHQALRQGFIDFGKKMNGYFTNEAVLHATESRTSSPVKIPRDHESCEHIQIKGLYPCGEGAGYAGGIMSAAIDGMKCANAIAGKSMKSA